MLLLILEVYVCVAIVGVIDRLGSNYRNEAQKIGVDIRIYTRFETVLHSKVRNVDAFVIFTNKVSHQLRKGGDSCI